MDGMMFLDMWDNLQQVRYDWKPWYAKNKREIRKPLNLWQPNWKRKVLWVIALSLPTLLAMSFLDQIGVNPFSGDYVTDTNRNIQIAALVTFRLSGFSALFAIFHLIGYGLLYQMGRAYERSRDIDARARRLSYNMIKKEDNEIRLIWIVSIAGLFILTTSLVLTTLSLAPSNSMAAKNPEEIIVPLTIAIAVVLAIFILPTTLIRHIDILRTGIPVELLRFAFETEKSPSNSSNDHDISKTSPTEDIMLAQAGIHTATNSGWFHIFNND